MRYLGIDYGTKRIGLALSDDAGLIAFAHKILPSKRDIYDQLARACVENKIKTIVVGAPSTDTRSDASFIKELGQFVSNLRMKTKLPVEEVNESFTSVEAVRPLNQKKILHAKQVKKEHIGNIDARAAAIILQRYLDSRKTRNK